MRRISLGLSIATLACAAALADTPPHPQIYDAFIAQQAQKHGVPERLVHRIVQRESRYNPRVTHNSCFGLMQIKVGTARSMGYKGDARGLLDPHVNMTYAIPYLSNAYRIAGGNEDRAVQLFAAGYYYSAKKQQMLAELRTADSPPLTPEPAAAPAPPEPPRSPVSGLLAFLSGAPQSAPRTDYPQQGAAAAIAAVTAAPGAGAPAATNAPAPSAETPAPSLPASPAPRQAAQDLGQAAQAPLVVASNEPPASEQATPEKTRKTYGKSYTRKAAVKTFPKVAVKSPEAMSSAPTKTAKAAEPVKAAPAQTEQKIAAADPYGALAPSPRQSTKASPPGASTEEAAASRSDAPAPAPAKRAASRSLHAKAHAPSEAPALDIAAVDAKASPRTDESSATIR